MILLSLVLVILGAVLLVLGWFQDGLELIYLAIGSCLLAMLLLGVTVLQRRRTEPAGPTAPSPIAPASAATASTITSPPAWGATADATPADDAERPDDEATTGAGSGDAPDATRDAGTAEAAGTPTPARRDRRAAIVRVRGADDPAADDPATDDAPTPANDPATPAVDAAAPTDGAATPARDTADAGQPSGASGDALANVRGLGPSRRAALLERFGDVEGIRAASVEELTAVPGMSESLAASVKQQLTGD